MNVLTRKIGPLPAWAWGGLAAAAVWFFFLRQRGAPSPSGTSSSNGTSPAGQATTDYSLGYAQGLQSAGAQQGTTTNGLTLLIRQALSTGPTAPYDQGAQGPPIRQSPGISPTIGTAPFGSKITATGAAVTGQANELGNPLWYPVQYGGQTGWLNAGDVAGTGGARPGNSRSLAPVWSDAHPAVGGPVRYAHFVRAVGGPGNHQREVRRVASQAGVHPARVAMLNPVPTGMIRVA